MKWSTKSERFLRMSFVSSPDPLFDVIMQMLDFLYKHTHWTTINQPLKLDVLQLIFVFWRLWMSKLIIIHIYKAYYELRYISSKPLGILCPWEFNAWRFQHRGAYALSHGPSWEGPPRVRRFGYRKIFKTETSVLGAFWWGKHEVWTIIFGLGLHFWNFWNWAVCRTLRPPYTRTWFLRAKQRSVSISFTRGSTLLGTGRRNSS